MVVDLVAHGRRDLAFIFLNRYLDLRGDHAGLDVLRFQRVLRAVQRAIDMPPGTPASRHGGAAGASEHLRLALRLAHDTDPRLLITHGPPGAGRHFAAQLLLERAGAIRISRAVELRRLAGWQARPAEAQRR